MSVRTSVRTAVAAAAAVAVVAGGTAVAVAATAPPSGPTGLCLAGTGVVTAATAEGGRFTCPSGRNLVVLASQADAESLRAGLGDAFALAHGLQDQVWGLGSRLDGHDGELLGLGDRVSGTESGLFTATQDLEQTRQELATTRSQLDAARADLAALQARTALSRVSEVVTVDTAATRSVSCGNGSALSGSSRDDGTRVVSSSVTEDGRGWTFLLEAPGGNGTATLTVVCVGRTVTATPGGVEGPGAEGPGAEGPGAEGPGAEGPGVEGP